MIPPRCLVSWLVPLALGLASIGARGQEAEIVRVESTFNSGGKAIVVERYEPKASGRYPAVVILHGSGGLAIGGPIFRDAARQLAGRGYVALVVHYFERTGTRFTDLVDLNGVKPEGRKRIAEHFLDWMAVVSDAVDHAASQPNVDPARIGLLGYSLGAYLALTEAARNPKVHAVVEYFGGLPEVVAGRLERMPPTLILHGEQDKVVPVAEARKLERLFREKGYPYEIALYPKQGHGFFGDDGADAVRRLLSFFDAHLKK